MFHVSGNRPNREALLDTQEVYRLKKIIQYSKLSTVQQMGGVSFITQIAGESIDKGN
ncbi:MAG: hypothetical protein Q8934_07685 [Bacillota bacterium]|nr:hypothetical protein [Bacillota bacterium]